MPKHGHLAFETEHGAPHVDFAELEANVVDQVPGSGVVRAIEHQVVSGDQLFGVAGIEPLDQGNQLDFRIHGPQTIGSGKRLGAAEIAHAVKHLALQIRQLDHVGIKQAEATDTGGGQVKRGWRTKAAKPDQEDAGRLELQLPFLPHFGQPQMATVTFRLRRAQGGRIVFQFWANHWW